MSDIREQVRERYAQAAVQATTGRASCCDDSCGDDCNTACSTHLYTDAELAALPEEAKLASLGCGNPTAVAELRPRETVLDLGSGGGIDVLLSAKRVGPEGKVYGLDMTDEMLALALANRDREGARNVEFLKGYIEEVPLPAATIDVVISNCVINLSADKPRVFAEMFRVLRPGGRIGVSDIVAEDHLTPADRAKRGSFVGCIAGALSFGEYERELREVGFEDVAVTPTHSVGDGMHSAIIRASKPVKAREEAVRRDLPLAAERSCC